MKKLLSVSDFRNVEYITLCFTKRPSSNYDMMVCSFLINFWQRTAKEIDTNKLYFIQTSPGIAISKNKNIVYYPRKDKKKVTLQILNDMIECGLVASYTRHYRAKKQVPYLIQIS